MGSKSAGSTIGFQYSMSIHMGIGRGPLDQIVEINAGDKMAWPIPGGAPVAMSGAHPSDTKPPVIQPPVDGVYTGNTQVGNGGVNSYAQYDPIYGNTEIYINAGELFGGDKGEGGIAGRLAVMMGAKTQIAPAWLKAIMGGNLPEFRGVCSVFFDGLICSMNPYPKKWRFRVRRITKGWDGAVWHPELATITLNEGAIKAMNPAHIIYECATNRDWGRGLPRTSLDDGSFLAVARTLFNENFGLCMRYNRQDDLDTFVETIINHIGGAIYTSRETGLITMALIRDDYDVSLLPFFDYNSGLLSIDEPEVSAREDNVNEVIVNYHDPIRHEDRTIRAQNLASRQTTGTLKSSTVEYPGVPNGGLAGQLASRDLRVASTSGRRYNLKFDRSAWRLVPGGVIVVSAPDKGITRLVLRIGTVDQKWITGGDISVVAVPDVFGMPVNSFNKPVENGWTPPDREPKQITTRLVREATYRDLFLHLDRSEFAQITDSEAYVVGIGGKPTGSTMDFVIATKTSVETGYEDRDTGTFPPIVSNTSAISITGTTVPFNAISDADQIVTPCAAQIEDEIVRVNTVTMAADGLSGTMNITRGCVDTVPTVHNIGSKIIFFDTHLAFDPREYAATEIINAKLLSRTSTGKLPYDFALVDSVTLVGRQGLPYAATNVKVNGVSIFSTTPRAEDVLIEWNHRNRVIQQDKLIGYFEPAFALEAGVSYRIKISFDGNVIRTVNNITASSYTYTKAMGIADGISATDQITFTLETMKGSNTAINTSGKLVSRGT